MDWLKNLFGTVTNAFGGASNAIGGALKTGGNAIGGAVNAGSNIAKNYIGGSNPFNMFGGGKTQSAPATSIPSFSGSKQAMLPAPAMIGMAAPSMRAGMDNTTNPDAKTKKSGFGGILEQLFPGGTGAGIAGLAIPAIGDMFAPKVGGVPDINSLSSVQAMQNFRPGNSMSPEYKAMLQHENDRTRETKVRELQALYHNARPGTDYLTDSNYQRDVANLDRELQSNMADNLARGEATFSQQEQDRLSQIAQMDIYGIMAQTGLDVQEANDFKQMFSNVGNMFLTNATKKPDDNEAMKQFIAKMMGA